MKTAVSTVTPAGESPIRLVRDLLVRRAVELALLTPDAPEAEIPPAIEAVLAREVVTPEPTEEECSRYYATHLDEFTSGDLVYARHILFAVTPGAPVPAIRAKAEETLLALQRDPERFEDLARELSNCPSAANGGHLGQLGPEDVAPEFAAGVFGSRHTGLLPWVVRTRYGFHVIAIDQRVEAQLVPFEAVRDRISTELRERVQETALRQYVQLLATQAGVEIPGLPRADSPLLQ